MYNVLPQEYSYKRRICVAGGINIGLLLILLNTHGTMTLSNVSFKPTQVSAISIQKYKITHQKKTSVTSAPQPIEPPKVVHEQPKKPTKKHITAETPKKQTEQQNIVDTQPQQAVTETTDTTQQDVPVIEASHFGMNNNPPQYPIISFQLGEYGNVVIEYIISELGTVQEAKIVQSSGFARLDKTAILSFQKWKFTPAKNIAGQSVPSRKKTITFAFDIKTQEIKAE
ncbi:MAG: TonB family protein [Proteobacteria bacterium]|jgi:TonB family protein|nr:TonB family protein [Pseudomonadota bacterium]